MAEQRREVTINEDQLGRINHMRERAGNDAITKEQAEAILAALSREAYDDAMDRIGRR